MREVLCGVSGVSGCGEWKVGGLVGGWTGYNSYRLCGFCCSLVGYGEDEIYLDTAFFTLNSTAVLEIRCPCSTGLKIASIAFTTVWKNPRFVETGPESTSFVQAFRPKPRRALQRASDAAHVIGVREARVHSSQSQAYHVSSKQPRMIGDSL